MGYGRRTKNPQPGTLHRRVAATPKSASVYSLRWLFGVAPQGSLMALPFLKATLSRLSAAPPPRFELAKMQINPLASTMTKMAPGVLINRASTTPPASGVFREMTSLGAGIACWLRGNSRSCAVSAPRCSGNRQNNDVRYWVGDSTTTRKVLYSLTLGRCS